MTATLIPEIPEIQTLPVTSARPLKVTQARVLLSEWTKFRSLRSTVWTLLVAAILMVGFGALFAAVTASQYHNFDAGQRASFSPISTSLNGTLFAQLAIGVLGVLIISGEYSTGMIRSSLTAVPRRLPVLWGKLIVFAGVTFAVSLVSSFVAFFLGQALLSGHNLDASISDPGALRSVFGAALYVTVAGLIGVALGSIMRNTAAAISTFVGVFFVLPPIASLLPSAWSSHFVQYLPSNAGSALYGATDNLSNPLSPWGGFAVLATYAVVLIVVAAQRLKTVHA